VTESENLYSANPGVEFVSSGVASIVAAGSGNISGPVSTGGEIASAIESASISSGFGIHSPSMIKIAAIAISPPTRISLSTIGESTGCELFGATETG
jgi:hypothetical protein